MSLTTRDNKGKTIWYIRFPTSNVYWHFPKKIPQGLPATLSYMNGYLGQRGKKAYYMLYLKFARKISYANLKKYLFDGQDVPYFTGGSNNTLAKKFREEFGKDKVILGPWRLGREPSDAFNATAIRYVHYTPIESKEIQNREAGIFSPPDVGEVINIRNKTSSAYVHNLIKDLNETIKGLRDHVLMYQNETRSNASDIYDLINALTEIENQVNTLKGRFNKFELKVINEIGALRADYNYLDKRIKK